MGKHRGMKLNTSSKFMLEKAKEAVIVRWDDDLEFDAQIGRNKKTDESESIVIVRESVGFLKEVV